MRFLTRVSSGLVMVFVLFGSTVILVFFLIYIPTIALILTLTTWFALLPNLAAENRLYSHRKNTVLMVRRMTVIQQLSLFTGLVGTAASCIWMFFKTSLEINLFLFPFLLLSHLLLWQSRRWLGQFYAPEPVMYRMHKVITGGPYRLVRHPLYASLLAYWIFSGWTCNVFRNLVATSIFAVSFLLVAYGLYCRALIEEELLGLSQMMVSVPRFVPTFRSLIAYLKEPFFPTH